MNRRNHLEVFSEKSVLKKFAKFAGEQVWQSLFFNKFAGLKSASLFLKKLRHLTFKNPFLYKGTLVAASERKMYKINAKKTVL